MFGPPGRAYVYFTYGSHWMLNVSAGPTGQASAVLIRAAMPIAGLDTMRARRPTAIATRDLLSGPGKLASAYGITGGDYGLDLFDELAELSLLPGEAPSEVLHGTRVGLSEGKGTEHPWRFVSAQDVLWASSPRSTLTSLGDLESAQRWAESRELLQASLAS
jgi:DNA-3-methyladenine glycosylase